MNHVSFRKTEQNTRNGKFKDQNDLNRCQIQLICNGGYIFHMQRKLYATLIGRIAFFTCEL